MEIIITDIVINAAIAFCIFSLLALTGISLWGAYKLTFGRMDGDAFPPDCEPA